MNVFLFVVKNLRGDVRAVLHCFLFVFCVVYWSVFS